MINAPVNHTASKFVMQWPPQGLRDSLSYFYRLTSRFPTIEKFESFYANPLVHNFCMMHVLLGSCEVCCRYAANTVYLLRPLRYLLK